MRYLYSVIGSALMFTAVVAVLVAVMPPPLRPVDYFLCGVAGTLAGSVVLFLSLAWAAGIEHLFYKSRRSPARLTTLHL